MKSEERKEEKGKKGTISGLISFVICLVILFGLAYIIYNRYQSEQKEAEITRRASDIKITQYRCGNILYILLHCNNNIVVINHTADSLELVQSHTPSLFPSKHYGPSDLDLPIFKLNRDFKMPLNELSFLK
jgi:hypothetical protein